MQLMLCVDKNNRVICIYIFDKECQDDRMKNQKFWKEEAKWLRRLSGDEGGKRKDLTPLPGQSGTAGCDALPRRSHINTPDGSAVMRPLTGR